MPTYFAHCFGRRTVLASIFAALGETSALCQVTSVTQQSDRQITSRSTSEIQAGLRRIELDPSHRKNTGSGPVLELAPPPCGPSQLTQIQVGKLVVGAAQRHGVEATFALAIALVESRLDQDRNSSKGARGAMQLMPETASRFGVVDVCDTEQNIEAGLQYLRLLQDEFQNPLLVAAAYNSGEGRVRAYGGIPPFRETLGYVAKVINQQVKLQAETATSASGDQALASSTVDQELSAVGVVGVRKTGKFVGGVMHF